MKFVYIALVIVAICDVSFSFICNSFSSFSIFRCTNTIKVKHGQNGNGDEIDAARILEAHLRTYRDGILDARLAVDTFPLWHANSQRL